MIGPVVQFRDGTRLDYAPPRNTLDPRHAACAEHRVGCDCREAELAEELAEYRSRWAEVERAAEEVLAGHAAYAWRVGQTGEQEPVHCMCTGCQIARGAHLHAAWKVSTQPSGATES